MVHQSYTIITYRVSQEPTDKPCKIDSLRVHTSLGSEQVTLTNVGGMTQINNNNYYVQRISATQYDLYSDSGLTTAVNGLGYTGYTSGGEMSSQTFRSYGPRYAPNTILQVQSHILPGNVTYGVTNTYIDGPTSHIAGVHPNHRIVQLSID